MCSTAFGFLPANAGLRVPLAKHEKSGVCIGPPNLLRYPVRTSRDARLRVRGTIVCQYQAQKRVIDLRPVQQRPSVQEYVVAPGTSFSFDDSDPLKHGYAHRGLGVNVLKENLLHNSHFQTQLFAERERSLLLIIHGMHTSGKSACIKRVMTGMDPSGMHVIHFGEKSQVEKKHDFLWRPHMNVPPKGFLGIWNRSHYEDVVTARVKGEVDRSTWIERYAMINAFEKILSLNGTKVVKVLLNITEDEQLSRLGLEALLPLKAWNVSPADYEQRIRWAEYAEAWEDAISATSTDYAPWYVVPANEKWARNAIVSDILASSFRSMQLRYPSRVFRARRLVKRITKQYQKAGLIRGKVKRKVKVK